MWVEGLKWALGQNLKDPKKRVDSGVNKLTQQIPFDQMKTSHTLVDHTESESTDPKDQDSSCVKLWKDEGNH